MRACTPTSARSSGRPTGSTTHYKKYGSTFFARFHSWRIQARFSAWIYRIAHNRAMRELRKRRPHDVPLEGNELFEETDDNVNISEVNAARIHAALNQLAPEHREVLLLRFMNDMSYEDIASVTGCPVGTVRSRIHYAKCALRRALMVDQQ